MRKIIISLVILGIVIATINMVFFSSDGWYVAGVVVLMIAACLMLYNRYRKEQYTSMNAFVKGEADIIFLLFAIVVFGGKYFFPEPYETSLHMFSLGLMLMAMALRNRIHENRKKLAGMNENHHG